MHRITFPLLLNLTLLFACSGHAQRPGFRAGLVAGINFAELEGEGLTDYFGLNAGISSSIQLSRHWQIGLELLWSQNGEYILPDFYPSTRYGKIWLNHLELPVHLDYLACTSKKKEYADWHLSVGVAYARLVHFYLEDFEKKDRSPEVIFGRKDGLLLQWGTTYYFTPNLGWNLRASLPLQEGLGWTIASRIVYSFI